MAGACLRKISVNDWIIVTYADSGMHHNGYIYQACNFLYTGATRQRTDKYTDGNKHGRQRAILKMKTKIFWKWSKCQSIFRGIKTGVLDV